MVCIEGVEKGSSNTTDGNKNFMAGETLRAPKLPLSLETPREMGRPPEQLLLQ